MAFMNSFLSGTMTLLGTLWHLFLAWLSIFLAPFTNHNLLWIIIPIWLSWFFAEFYQEKRSTSFGNAISNAVVPLWVGIDWTRFLVNQLITKQTTFDAFLIVKFLMCVAIFIYGLAIIIHGIKAKKFIHYLGRIRVVTYVLLMFTPIIYGVVELSWEVVGAMVIFFPAFYYIIEFIDRRIPDPESLRQDTGGETSYAQPSNYSQTNDFSGRNDFSQDSSFSGASPYPRQNTYPNNTSFSRGNNYSRNNYFSGGNNNFR